ncbi:MAG: PsbP-related protein [Prolixibacteraceae bacterium]|jgi:outer membrane biogenesis lipoprotein LolB|nr:PsbP-related protein [Prolixibacteraceae bacterium]
MLRQKNLLVIVALLFLFACSNANKSAEKIQKNWKTFETTEYSIKYPPAWALNQTGYQGTSFLLISKQTSIRDFYQENVSLVEEALSDTTINLQSYVQRSLEMLSDSNSTIKMVENVLQENDQENYHKLLYGQMEGVNKVIVEKHYFIRNNKAYILTFSCKGIERKRYMPIGEGILNSFKLK